MLLQSSYKSDKYEPISLTNYVAIGKVVEKKNNNNKNQLEPPLLKKKSLFNYEEEDENLSENEMLFGKCTLLDFPHQSNSLLNRNGWKRLLINEKHEAEPFANSEF